MFNFRKIGLISLAIVLAPLLLNLPSAAGKGDMVKEGTATLYLFWGNGCPHCEKEKEFLKNLKQRYPGLQIKDYEVWYNRENAAFFKKVVNAVKIKAAAVPLTLVNGKFFVGFSEQTGKGIEEAVKYCAAHGCRDTIEIINELSLQEEQKILKLPLLGQVDATKISLPVFTVIIGALDSFNPCAFFVLLFLLSLLVHAKSRKRMFLIGGIFVFFSGFVYFLFMAAWLNIFLIIGQLLVITTAAGLIALAVALINIKDFFLFKKGVSLAIPEKSKPRLFERMRNLLKSPSLPAMIGGTIVLAITANAYELLCTAGFPMVYTRILTLHNLPMLQYYMYLVLYNIVYVMPLAAIVIAITLTLGAKKLTEWQGRKLKLISGVMMFSLALVLLISPAYLNNALAAIALLAASLAASGVIIILAKKIKPHIAAS